MESIKQSIMEMNQQFHSQMEVFLKRQRDLEASGSVPAGPDSSLVALTSDFKVFQSFVLDAFKRFQCQIQVLSDSIDQMEMHSRRKYLMLHGVPEQSNEELCQVVPDLLANKLQLPDFSSNSIRSLQRIGHKSTGKPRPILLKFENVTIKNKIWHAKSCLKGSGYTLSEFLTKNRHKTFLLARERFGVNQCWTRNGNIIVCGPDGSRHHVRSVVDLDVISVRPADDLVPANLTGSVPANKEKIFAASSRSKRATKK